jgi:hypothetical protein
MHAHAVVRYVSITCTNPIPPYTSWDTAATNIQDAVDAAASGDRILVTNGVYQSGGRAVGTNLLVNRIAVIKPLSIQSVNGPEGTIIRGYQVPDTTNGDTAVRCAYLTNGATLIGFTLAEGATRSRAANYYHELSGGAAFCESPTCLLSNCVLIGSSAIQGGGIAGGTLKACLLINNSAWPWGGGAYNSLLENCSVIGNSAQSAAGGWACTFMNCTINSNSAVLEGGGGRFCTFDHCVLSNNIGLVGGGAVWSTLNNCAVAGNSADQGGGVAGSFLTNCTVVGNTAIAGGGADTSVLYNCVIYYNTGDNFLASGNIGDEPWLNYCCVTPLPEAGVGNITNAPLFVDPANGDFRPQTSSPCINAGNNGFVTSTTDLDGNARISGGTVDMGAYELVFTPAMLVDQLMLTVEQAKLGTQNKQPLLAILSAALAALDRGNTTAALNHLSAFQNKVRAQSTPTDPQIAARFLQTAQEVIDALTR